MTWRQNPWKLIHHVLAGQKIPGEWGIDVDILKVENLTKKYGNFTAVAGISFRSKGNIWFWGPMGRENATINMLTGLARCGGFGLFSRVIV